MEKIIKPRQTGKTTDLIEISEKTGIYILTADRKRAECVFRLAQEQKRNIPFPVTLWEYQQNGFRGSFINHILIDDADAVLQELFGTIRIDALTMTGPEQHKVEDIKTQICDHYCKYTESCLRDETLEDAMSPEKKDQIPDIRVTTEQATEAIQNLTKAGISQEDIREDLINLVNGLNQSLMIIGKYKAESEDKT